MTSSFCIFFSAVNVDFRPDVPRAATEDVPQLRCVGSERGVLTGWVSLLARCDLTVVKLAGLSRQVGCCWSHSEPKG